MAGLFLLIFCVSFVVMRVVCLIYLAHANFYPVSCLPVPCAIGHTMAIALGKSRIAVCYAEKAITLL
jgi:hypothetical protein